MVPALHHEPGSDDVHGVAGEAGGEASEDTSGQVAAGPFRNQLMP